ncbi:MAG: glutamate racemase [Firmicutes bacterium]|nr:glutamate racemase [Bacillota bacterium]
MTTQSPIAVFDSGEGGLTVLRQARELYPDHDFLYGADSLHFPYGSRPLSEVRDLFLRFLDFFLSRGVQAVVIACNTATAAALDEARRRSPVPVIGVVEAGAQQAAAVSRNRRIGVLSTLATYRSGIYRMAVQARDPTAEVVQRACPDLVTMAEAGETESEAARLAVRACLTDVFRRKVDTVVLGCTHFPHMERIFREEVGDRAAIIDPGLETARRLGRLLPPGGGSGQMEFFTTGDPRRFERITASLWPGIPVQAQRLIWRNGRYEAAALVREGARP